MVKEIQIEIEHVIELLQKSTLQIPITKSFTDSLSRNILPQLNLFTRQSNKASTGRSKFGGKPDLPLGLVWPKNVFDNFPLTFFAQINLSEIPMNFLSQNQVGFIYFFVDNRQISEQYPKPLINRCKVIYSPVNDIKSLKFPPQITKAYEELDVDEMLIQDSIRTISFEPTISLPTSDSKVVKEWGIESSNWDTFLATVKEYYETSQITMFGHCWSYQQLELDQLSDYTNLLQIANYNSESWQFIETNLPNTITEPYMASRNFGIPLKSLLQFNFENVVIHDDYD